MAYRNLQEKFTTFFQVVEDYHYLRVVNLQKDYHLLKSFQSLIDQGKNYQFDLSENDLNDLTNNNSQNKILANKRKSGNISEFYAKVLLKNILNNQEKYREKQHLSAYLEETCFYLTNQELKPQLSWNNLSILDVFSTARGFAAMPEKTLKNYDFVTSQIDTFARRCIRDATKESFLLRHYINKYSDWGILRHVSKKKLREALRSNYNNDNLIDHIVVAIDSYKAIYRQQSSAHSLPEPSIEEWQAIQILYEQLCQQHQLPSLTDIKINIAVNQTTLTQLLMIAVISARKYFDQQFVSLSHAENLAENLEAEENFSINLLQIFSVDTSMELEHLAMSDLSEDLENLLRQEFGRLPIEMQNMYKLYYGLHFTQTNLGKIFNLPQHQISRLINRHLQPLLKSLAQWSQTTHDIQLNSQQINDLKSSLQDWLISYCEKYFGQILEAYLLGNLSEHLQLLQYYYGELLKPTEIAEKLGILTPAFMDINNKVQELLQNQLHKYLIENLLINLDILPEKSINKSLSAFVKNALANAPYATYEQNYIM